VPLTVNLDTKVSAWIQASAVALVVGFLAFGWLHGVMLGRFQQAVDRELARRDILVTHVASADEKQSSDLPWQPYSHELLKKLTAEGKTVFVDFTADWCLTCKSNEAVALNTATTKKFIEANGVATVKADKTGLALEVDELLMRLGNKGGSIPFYAIFPANNPNKPILLDGLFTSPQPILDALQTAGPSRQPAIIGAKETVHQIASSHQSGDS